MSDAWDADDYEPPAAGSGGASKVVATDKWEGEDEDDDVKDAWDADSDEEDEKVAAAPAAKPAAKKKLRSKIALREAAEAQADEDLTPEEKAAEKLRAMKMEENAQMSLTRDMLGLKSGAIDSMVPVTKEDFESFGKALAEKIRLFNNSEHYQDLLESITKDLVIDMTVPTLKKVKIHVEGMHSTRLKEEKSKSKPKVGKGKTSLKNDLDKDLFGGGGGAGGYDDDGMDDFM